MPPAFRQQQQAARNAARTRQRAQLAARGAGFTPEGAALYAGGKAAGAAKSAAQTAGQARIPTGDRRYQSVILAEFVTAVVVIAGLPLASGGSPNAQAKGGMSPYDTGDLKQLAAVGGVYFILALLSSGSRGRLAAWFGGLVLIGLAFSKYPLIKTAVMPGSGQEDAGNTSVPAAD